MNVAECREAEICSVRKAELRREMFAGWRREKLTWRSEDAVKKQEGKKEAAEGIPVFSRMKCSSAYAVRKLSECCCLYTALSATSGRLPAFFCRLEKMHKRSLKKAFFLNKTRKKLVKIHKNKAKTGPYYTSKKCFIFKIF